MGDAPKLILELRNFSEATWMDAILTEEQIPHRVVSNGDPAYAGIFQVQNGWGHIEAPPEYEGEIHRIYRDMQKSRVPRDDWPEEWAEEGDDPTEA
jgi:hypothetical protein